MFERKSPVIVALALAGGLFAGTAHAGRVNWSVNINVPGPVYAEPVYYAPRRPSITHRLRRCTTRPRRRCTTVRVRWWCIRRPWCTARVPPSWAVRGNATVMATVTATGVVVIATTAAATTGRAAAAAAGESHSLEEVAVEAAHRQLVGVAAQAQRELAALVARGRGDGVRPHHRAPVDLPEALRVELREQLTQ